jgi:hypothetical protein
MFDLSDKIWKTKKARANASSRLKNNDIISQSLIIYYSLFIVGLTIFDMKHKYVNMETLTLVLSIIILTISVFILSMDYKSRSEKLLTLNIKLDKLFYKAIKYKDDKQKTEIIHKKYLSLLESSENHSSYDFLKVRYEVKDDEKYKDLNSKFKYSDYFSYYFHPILKFLIILFFVSIPIFILYLYSLLGLI